MTTVDVTMLLQGTRVEDQIGDHTAFGNLVATGVLGGYRSFPYRAARTADDWRRVWSALTDHMRESGSNVLHLQYFHLSGAPDPRPWIEEIRALPQAPIVATSCGDPFGGIFRSPPASLLRAASVADVTFTTSMGALADRLDRAGAQRVTLMPWGACDIRFARAQVVAQEEPEFDVVFVGNRIGGRNPLSDLARRAKRRSVDVERLARRYGTRFGLFGQGWEGVTGWQGPIRYERQVEACTRARVVFGGVPHSGCAFYTSDRPFIQSLAGVPIVDQRVPGVEVFLREDVEWLLFDDFPGAVRAIDAVLDGTIDGPEIGRSGSDAVRARHLVSHRVDLMVEIFTVLLEARRSGTPARCPPLNFLRADLAPEWHGEAARW